MLLWCCYYPSICWSYNWRMKNELYHPRMIMATNWEKPTTAFDWLSLESHINPCRRRKFSPDELLVGFCWQSNPSHTKSMNTHRYRLTGYMVVMNNRTRIIETSTQGWIKVKWGRNCKKEETPQTSNRYKREREREEERLRERERERER